MKVEVRPINVKGKPLSKREREKFPAHVGKLRVQENRLHKFGRALMSALLVNVIDDVESLVLPELFDAAVIWMNDQQIRIRGFEEIDGYQHAQTWDIRVL